MKPIQLLLSSEHPQPECTDTSTQLYNIQDRDVVISKNKPKWWQGFHNQIDIDIKNLEAPIQIEKKWIQLDKRNNNFKNIQELALNFIQQAGCNRVTNIITYHKTFLMAGYDSWNLNTVSNGITEFLEGSKEQLCKDMVKIKANLPNLSLYTVTINTFRRNYIIGDSNFKETTENTHFGCDLCSNIIDFLIGTEDGKVTSEKGCFIVIDTSNYFAYKDKIDLFLGLSSELKKREYKPVRKNKIR